MRPIKPILFRWFSPYLKKLNKEKFAHINERTAFIIREEYSKLCVAFCLLQTFLKVFNFWNKAKLPFLISSLLENISQSKSFGEL